ncbi:MAG: BlaI/MecI/CopY family transcriptional regulator [Acidobacteriota bacterium]
MAEPKAPAGPDGGNGASASPLSVLGRREREVLSAVRDLGSATVQQVAERLDSGLAYTTVMTTLDRLFRKGLLSRRKQNRAFLYSMAFSARDLEGHRAAHLIRRFFSESDARPEILVSCLVDAVHHYDTELLDQLESRIREAREQAGQRDSGATGKQEGDR